MSNTFRIEIEMSKGWVDQDTIAGRLLTVFDRDGEAAMLNALHGSNPDYAGSGVVNFGDGSRVVYVERLNCYCFAADGSAPLLSSANALRPCVLEVEPPSHDEDLGSGDRILNLTGRKVLAELITTLALQRGINLPDDFVPHHGLVAHMAPDADRTLYDVFEQCQDDPDNNYIEEKIQDIREMLARRVLAALPAHQVWQLEKTVENLATGD